MDPAPQTGHTSDRPSRAGRLLLGMVVGNGVAAFIIGLEYLLNQMLPASTLVVGLPSLVLVPFCVGLTAAWFWRPLRLGIGAVLLQSLGCMALGLILGVVIFREGLICLIILSPIFYAGIAAGGLLGRLWFRQDRDRLNLCLAPALVLLIIAEPTVRSRQLSVVSDSIKISAPPAKVWPHVLAFNRIPEPPDYWLFRLGLPYPTETSNQGHFVGAKRSCQFSGGAEFKEVVSEFVVGKRLTFEIVEMPPDPELIGHLDAYRGQFELLDNGDGTTTLVGRTWYSLHVRPAWYFDWWTHQIFRAVHLRVMRHVKNLSEIP